MYKIISLISNCATPSNISCIMSTDDEEYNLKYNKSFKIDGSLIPNWLLPGLISLGIAF